MHVVVFLIPRVCIFQLFSDVAKHLNIDITFLYCVTIVPLECDTTV